MQYRLGEPLTYKSNPKPLYNLHLLTQNPDAVVFIVEGEYPADKLNEFFNQQGETKKYIAITSGGATSAETANWQPLMGRHCIIWPDHDEPGMKYAQQIADKLEQLDCKIESIDPTTLNLTQGDDCVDWLTANPLATSENILALPRLHQTTDNCNELQETLETTIARLASLSPIQYDRVRKDEAKKLLIRPITLDNMVKAARTEDREESNTPFSKIEPWLEPIILAELLTEIDQTIRRFIVCPPETTHAATLWIAMTWVIDVIQIAPLAIITAPEKRCGKSQLLFLLGRLVNRPLSASNITPAALFRSIDAWHPTLLIDEADAFVRENEELRGLLNCGHTRDSAYTIRLVGDNHTPKRFNVWGAKALAGIGNLADTLMDRAIVLQLRRKLANEQVERLRHAEPELFNTLSSKLARFAEDYADQIQKAIPNLPDTLNDRAQDNWEPLLAIADIAGGSWPRLARLAALKLSGNKEQSKSIGVELLADIQEVFDHQHSDRIPSKNLIAELCVDEEKVWATYNRGHQITPRQIASRLKEFGIISNTIRIGEITVKGYLKSQFTDAFNRYLTGPLIIDVTPSQTNCDKSFLVTDTLSVSDINVTNNYDVTLDSNVIRPCDAVTDKLGI